MITITGTYQKHAIQQPEKIAIQTLADRINYRDWYEIVCKTANWLHSCTDADERVGIFMPNSIAFLQLFTGAAMAGRIAATFDAKWKPAELERRLTISSPSVIITTRELKDRISVTDANIVIWEEALEQIRTCESSWNTEVEGKTPFYMGFTSGTTGMPKAFIRSHKSWVASFDCNRHDFLLDETDVVLIPGALIHSHFLFGAVSTLFLGGTLCLLENFSPSRTLNVIESFPVTVLYVVPTMVEAMLLEDVTIKKSLKIISSGAKWEESSKQKNREQFLDLTMFEFYGASELSYVSFLSDLSNQKAPHSVGRPFHNVDIQIRLDNGKLAPIQEIGKIFVRSNMVFCGYIDPKSGAIQSIKDQDGWVTVDDMGYVDENGFLYVVGRETNMILSGGVNIFPEEIEAVLKEHPQVEEAAVVGVDDSYWGQIPVAVLKGTAPQRELKRLCMEKLSAYKIPRKWLVVADFPYTTSGKISRMHVKQLVEAEVVANG